MHSLIYTTAMLAALVAAPGDLPAGAWRQASDGVEVMLETRIKLTPGAGSWGGTSYGGSAGLGSMTETRTVVQPTPRRVARAMTLTIAGSGAFDWTIEQRFADAKGCVRTVQQHKTGLATMQGDRIGFAITGGEETSRGCGKDAVTKVATGAEQYGVSRTMGTMVLAGAGGVRWTFRS